MVLTLALYLVFYSPNEHVSSKQRASRIAVFAVIVIAISFASSSLMDRFQGQSYEQDASIFARGFVYSAFLGDIRLFGQSPTFNPNDVAVASIIDPWLLPNGLTFGWIVVAFYLFPLALASIRAFGSRASIAEIALVGQIPMFATVSLITQYESVIFLVVGIAIQIATDQTVPTVSGDKRWIRPP